jgi:N-acyl-D-aspartate/D-glutamate deacylase
MYDVILTGAKIVDGSGQAAVRGDIAVAGSKIAEVGRLNKAEAKTFVDAAGKVIAPGFIDIHSHADFSLPVLPTAESLIHQGITTVVIGQCGLSPAPLLSETRDKVVSALCGFFGDFAKAIPWDQWNSFEDYLNFLERIRSGGHRSHGQRRAASAQLRNLPEDPGPLFKRAEDSDNRRSHP